MKVVVAKVVGQAEARAAVVMAVGLAEEAREAAMAAVVMAVGWAEEAMVVCR